MSHQNRNYSRFELLIARQSRMPSQWTLRTVVSLGLSIGFAVGLVAGIGFSRFIEWIYSL